MQDPMMFTTARPDQTSMLVALVNRAYSSRPEDAGWVGDRTFRPGERTDEAEVSELLADPRSVMLLGSSEGVTRSCVALTYRADSAYLSLFAVEPDRQGSGVGRLTMGAAETRLRQRQGIDHIGIHVLEHHSALIAW
jgi:GNAT superfamily N-acetyltransferase